MNKVFLIGNLGKDIEVTTAGNVVVGKFSLATTENYKDGDGNWQDKTTWHNVDLFKPTDHKKANLKKGAQVVVEGRIENYSYEKDGETRYGSAVTASKVDILVEAGARGNSSSSDSGSFTESAPTPEAKDNTTDDLPF